MPKYESKYFKGMKMDSSVYDGSERRDGTFKCSEESRIVDIEHILKGNGQEGLQTRVIRIEEKLDTLIKGRTNWGVVVSIGVSIAVLILMGLSYMRGIPV